MVTLSYENGNVNFSLTDNFMDTIINNKDSNQAIIVNNLFICSVFERGEEFCSYALKQPDKKFPVGSELFKVNMDCYPDGTFVVYSMITKMRVKFHYSYLKNYYENVLCKIIVQEKNMESGLDFHHN